MTQIFETIPHSAFCIISNSTLKKRGGGSIHLHISRKNQGYFTVTRKTMLASSKLSVRSNPVFVMIEFKISVSFTFIYKWYVQLPLFRLSCQKKTYLTAIHFDIEFSTSSQLLPLCLEIRNFVRSCQSRIDRFRG